MRKNVLPKQNAPPGSFNAKLHLYNSLTRDKEVFLPQCGNKVLWYSCGPTVYDAAHLGHARSYISFDILRRVLADYFDYDVRYVMNITDIDDKIIKRARQNYLFGKFKEANWNIDVISEIKKATQHYKTLIEKSDDVDKKNMLQKIHDSTIEAVKNVENNPNKEASEVLESLFESSKDVLSEWLDATKGSEVNNNTVFSELPARYEEEFFKDMKSLNVLKPNDITRVSEYIVKIIEYIKKIVENGFGYESNGSVYFDTVKFNVSPDHTYAKLVPEAVGDLKKLQEGEGDLSISSDRLQEKRSPSDFALWKASKPGEPSWESPWGKGRPGWHIECSAMASDVLGDSLDIHTGGYDLKFPHHDNELAQAEAYFGNDCWVRYFLHSGHLTISGCKMSKSLKNFITIREALEYHSPRQIRLAFLLHSWKDTLDYSSQTLDNALHYERVVKEFNLNVSDVIRNIPITEKMPLEMGNDAKDLQKTFDEKKISVDEALCDNVDTHDALKNIHELIKHTNKYLQKKKQNREISHQTLLSDIRSYILDMLRIFGADFESDKFQNADSETINFESKLMSYVNILADFREDVRQIAIKIKAAQIVEVCDKLRDDILPTLGVQLEDQEGLKAAVKFEDPKVLAQEQEQKCKNFESKLMPYVNVLADFREDVRQIAIKIKATQILEICDKLRDDILPTLGVRLEDQEGLKAAVKFEDPKVLAQEREQKCKLEEMKRLEKEEQKAKLKKLNAEKEALKKLSPEEFIRITMADKYSKFNEIGLPTHDDKGKQLSESQLKKVKKIYEAQKKKYETHQQSIAAS